MDQLLTLYPIDTFTLSKLFDLKKIYFISCDPGPWHITCLNSRSYDLTCLWTWWALQPFLFHVRNTSFSKRASPPITSLISCFWCTTSAERGTGQHQSPQTIYMYKFDCVTTVCGGNGEVGNKCEWELQPFLPASDIWFPTALWITTFQHRNSTSLHPPDSTYHAHPPVHIWGAPLQDGLKTVLSPSSSLI